MAEAQAQESQGDDQWRAPIRNFRVLLPVLDFDPLPDGMPLHAWLLEPWRLFLKSDKNGLPASCGGDDEDLSEKLADLADKAIAGWTRARDVDGGTVARTIAYREQTAGWLETRDTWRTFVDAVVCRYNRCDKNRGTHGRHRHLFVVAIDDVDLQVEELPSLLHAIRLFEHPNVLYILTGDLEHLQLGVRLDYRRRHKALAGRGKALPGDEPVLDEIRSSSDRLAKALLEKVLPHQVIVQLPMLALSEIGPLLNSGSPAELQITRLVKNKWAGASLPFVTARKAQYAIDRSKPKSAFLPLVADLCGTQLEPSKRKRSTKAGLDSEATDKQEQRLHRFAIRGRLSTTLSAPLRVLPGEKLRLTIYERPRFVFFSEFDSALLEERDEANRAVILQLLAEDTNSKRTAPLLHWNPDAGVLVTDVDWRRRTRAATARFHWPWLTRITATQVLTELGELGGALVRHVHGTAAELKDADGYRFMGSWLRSMINLSANVSIGEAETIEEALEPMEGLLANTGRKSDARDWLIQLLLLTAPYMGLAPDVAWRLRTAVCALRDKSKLFDADDIKKWQADAVGDAIEEGIRTFDDRAVEGSKEREDLVSAFLKERYESLDAVGRDLWIDEKGQFNSKSLLRSRSR
jgi:hypothetical protein